jgi:hypothetical protein
MLSPKFVLSPSEITSHQQNSSPPPDGSCTSPLLHCEPSENKTRQSARTPAPSFLAGKESQPASRWRHYSVGPLWGGGTPDQWKRFTFLMLKTRKAPDTDLAGYPANPKAGYPVRPDTGYPAPLKMQKSS